AYQSADLRNLGLANRAVGVAPAEMRAIHLDRPAGAVDLGEHDEPLLALVVARVARDPREDAYLVSPYRPTGDDRVPRACAVALEVRLIYGVVVTERRRELAGLVA